MVYNDNASGQAHKASGQCCFDPHSGHLCVALKPQGGPFACFGGNKHQSPRDKNAERYSLLRKLTITEPSPDVLELNFTVADKEGAPRIVEQQNQGSGKAKQRRLERIAISPCSATEIKVIHHCLLCALTRVDYTCYCKHIRRTRTSMQGQCIWVGMIQGLQQTLLIIIVCPFPCHHHLRCK